MTQSSNDNGLELLLSQIKDPLGRAEALSELASKGVHIPREIALEYVTYILLGEDLNRAINFARNTGLTELAQLIGIRANSKLEYESEQRYLDSVR